ncbi:hypothetical protein D9619_009862 [Psilocybe cf. subviscida]|uniref:Uncharacterized protein n=1 Tax=Psilocybe cf. subviscida TaxID=2480587 RepID=A0A8H5F6P8_9AGAR|nr:hypothetical protein D9619_009862 [Psilocybe cf. subviscida]
MTDAKVSIVLRVLTFLGVIGFALVAITASVALVLIGAFVSVAIKILVVALAGVVATVICPDAWRNRSLQNVLKHPRSIIIAVASAVGALLLRKPVGKLLWKLFRAKNNDVIFYPTTRPHGIPKPPICRGPHQRWPQHTAARPNPAWPWQKFVKPGSISQSPSHIIGGRQHISISSFLMRVIGKVVRILIHIGLYIVHLLHRAIIRVIDRSIRRILRLIRHIGFSGFILISLVVYVFVLHYKLRGSKKAGNKGKDRRRKDIRE